MEKKIHNTKQSGGKNEERLLVSCGARMKQAMTQHGVSMMMMMAMVVSLGKRPSAPDRQRRFLVNLYTFF